MKKNVDHSSKTVEEITRENKQLHAELLLQTDKVALLQEKFENLKTRKFFKIYRSLFRMVKGSDPIFEN